MSETTTPDDGATVVTVRGTAPYDVVIGRDLADRLPGMLGAEVQRIAFVAPERLEAYLDGLVESIAQLEVEAMVLAVPEGEDAKQIQVAEACWEALGQEGFTRSDAVVTLGGGATTDLGGFVAATWLRGIKVVHVPTTLLGMVDAAVGGKTGVNTEAGKNLVGAFHEPSGVLCDMRYLETLAREELVAGLAEVVKCGLVADPEILRLVEESGIEELVPGSPVLRELVERAVRVKAEVVADDLTETGGSRAGHPGREVLNYGHTLGHAIERVEGYAVRHGDAVAIGCVYAAELAALAGSLDPAVVQRTRDVLTRVGLPTGYDRATFDDLLAVMAVDKKTRGSTLRFVVLDDVAQPRVLAGPAEEHLRAAYAAIGGS